MTNTIVGITGRQQIIRVFISMTLLCCLSINIVFAENDNSCLNQSSMQEVKSTIDKILRDLEANKEKLKNNKSVVYDIIDQQLVPKADFGLMSRMVLTRKWRSLNDSQKAEFIKEFSKLMIRTYGVAFESYNGETVTYSCPIKELKKIRDKQRVEISTTVHGVSRPNSIVKFRLIDRNNAWLVYDLIIDNVSIINSYRMVFKDKYETACKEEARVTGKRIRNCAQSSQVASRVISGMRDKN